MRSGTPDFPISVKGKMTFPGRTIIGTKKSTKMKIPEKRVKPPSQVRLPWKARAIRGSAQWPIA
jgi:hypothetical protein